ncbi:hypothetical protein TKK_0013186 [Trichogramma kaykai]
MIFELSNNRHQPVKVNARDNLGYTPSLHLSLNNQYCKFHETVELLLTRGADPNMANEEGLTLLHIFCTEANHDLMTMFFNIIDQGNQVAQIEARDNEGNTPLHLALKYNSDKWVAVILLEKELFLKITNDQEQMVQVDAKDKKGWTPLQLAVEL